MEIELVMTEKPANIEAICRLCLSQRTDSLKSIFDEALSPNRLPLKILQLIQVQVTKNDKVSTMVCNDCIIRLDTWFSYKKQCHRNQAQLAEWLRSTGQSIHDVNVQIKTEPLDIDVTRHGILPVKVEYSMYGDMMDEEFNDLPHTFSSCPQNSDHVYLEDLDRDVQELEETEKCPDCGKVFGSVQNRRRHQNMVHRRDRRAQMMEIKKVQPEPPAPPQAEESSEKKPDSTDEQNSTPTVEQPTVENADNSVKNLNDSENNTCTVMDVTPPPTDTSKEDSTESPPEQANTENMPQEETNIEVKEEKPAENTDESQENPEKPPETKEAPEEQPTEEKPVDQNQDGQNDQDQKDEKPVKTENDQDQKDEKPVKTENDQQKIEFAAGLKLVQKDSTHIEFETLSKIELSYIEKCKAMVSMFHNLMCACHHVQHKTLRHLLSHLREVRVWFPLFTCYSCMISFTDRSTFTRHHCRCPKGQLETLIKLSNLRKRSEIKTRLYQNYKCKRCKFLYSFHEDFCKHINEDHGQGAPPIYCSCRNIFDTVEEYKTHCYTSCVLSFYCDICFITTSTIQEFVKHCEEIHDSSEGFVLLQEESSYTPRNNITFRPRDVDEEANVVEGKRERRKSTKEPILVHIYDKEIPPDPKDIPNKVLKQMMQLDYTTAQECNKKPTKCPFCKKEYSSVNNMVRHYRIHVERKEVELPMDIEQTGDDNEDLYSCPECGGMYPASRWKKHLEEKHQPISCTECDKVFQFQSELDQHRSVHLNLKVYRDSKTHAYKTAILSPGAESNGMVGEIMVMCEICDSMFKSKEELKHHKLTCHDANMSRASSSMENFEMPVEDPDSILEPPMEVEGATDSKENVDTDSLLGEKLPCDSCGGIYASAKSLKEHVMNKHGLDYLKKSEYPKKCDYCDKICTSGAGLALHTQIHERCQPDKKPEFPRKCEYCDKICTTGAGLYLHTQMHERMTLGDLKKEKTVTVKQEDKKKIIQETQEEEDESYHTCRRCFKVFGTKGKLKEHMKSHGINPSKPSLKPSLKKNRKILCDLCHIALESSEDLVKHKAEEHNDELEGMPTLKNELEMDEKKMLVVYTCDVCVQTFDSKLELQQHKETHVKPAIMPKTKKAPIFCKYCKIAFDSVNELTKHMHVEHGESAKPRVKKEKSDESKPFKCQICSKAFASHGAMTAHFGWHKRAGSTLEVPEHRNTQQATAAAKMARKQKVSQKLAKAAANKQEPIEPPEFQCAICLMELPNDTALQIHMLEKHRDLDSLMLIPRCDICNQDFVTQEEYDTHKRFHDFLNRQKKHEEQLQAQQQTLVQQQIKTPIIQSVQSVSESPQASPKRHPCNWCNSVFSRSDTLNAHIRHNHKEHVKTEFECTQCDRVFDKQNSLTIHLKVHEKQKNAGASSTMVVAGNGVSGGGKIYSCSICNQVFKFPKDLRMHTINDHPF